MKSVEEKLASEQCRRILEQLKSGPQTAAALSKNTKLSPGSIAKHLEVLETSDMVVRQPNGEFTTKR